MNTRWFVASISGRPAARRAALSFSTATRRRTSALTDVMPISPSSSARISSRDSLPGGRGAGVAAVAVDGGGVDAVAVAVAVVGTGVAAAPASSEARIVRAWAIAVSSSVIAARIVAASGETVGGSIAVPAGSRNRRTFAALRSSGAFEPSTWTIAHSTCRGSTAACECRFAPARASSRTWSRRATRRLRRRHAGAATRRSSACRRTGRGSCRRGRRPSRRPSRSRSRARPGRGSRPAASA